MQGKMEAQAAEDAARIQALSTKLDERDAAAQAQVRGLVRRGLNRERVSLLKGRGVRAQQQPCLPTDAEHAHPGRSTNCKRH